jgi:hypothetical protein
MKADTYSRFALPHEVIEAVRTEEARLTGRLADLPYEVTGALVEFRRAMFPMLTHLAYAVDPEGEPDVAWTREYAARRAKLEADVIVENATARATQGLAFAANRFKTERDALHKIERLASVHQKA